jgi:hypothetical protein
MKTINSLLALMLILLFIGVSCKSTKEVSTARKMVSNDSLFDKAWHDTLENNKEAMKEALLKVCNPINTVLPGVRKENYYSLAPETSLDSCEILPIEVFTIDSLALSKWDNDRTLPLESLMTLNKDVAEFYIVKDKVFYFHVLMKYNNNKWKWASYGPIVKSVADFCSLLYYEQKITASFRVCIINAFWGKPFVVYRKNGILMALAEGGVSKPFKEELAKWHDY